MVLGSSKGLGGGGVWRVGSLVSSIVVVSNVKFVFVFWFSSQKKGLGGMGGRVEVIMYLFGCREAL